MKKIIVGLHAVLLVCILVGCASSQPQLATTTPAILPTATFTPPPPVTILWPYLTDARIAADLEKLIELQNAWTSQDAAAFAKWNTNPVMKWNEATRAWVMYYAQDPVVASREYALVSVAQQRALDEFARVEVDRAGRKPALLNGKIKPVSMAADPYEAAVLIGATEPLFLAMFSDTPNDIHAQMDEARNSLLASGNILPADLELAEHFGQTYAEALIEERKDDGAANAKKVDALPSGDGIWKPDPFRARPEQPGWSKVTPWFMSAADQFRAPPPPKFGSVEFKAALDEVYKTVTTDTQKEFAIARKWADKRGTYTPPGHWNEIAADLILKYGLSDREAAHVFAAVNMAQMDAGIACWDSKYQYMVIRPWQADPQITPLVGYPNHPSYPSGHSCFSWAAAETLAGFFPQEGESLIGMAEEASISRLYGGIHYRMDLEAGGEIGRQVGKLADAFALQMQWEPLMR